MNQFYLDDCCPEPFGTVVRVVLVVEEELLTLGHELGRFLTGYDPESWVIKKPFDAVWMK